MRDTRYGQSLITFAPEFSTPYFNFFLRMKKIMLLLSAALLSAGTSQAQNQAGACGTQPDELLKNQLLANIATLKAGDIATPRNAIQYVPVFFHLVGDGQGNGKVQESKVLDQLCVLNADYAPMDIRFYLSPHPVTGALFNYGINNNNVYSNQTAFVTMNNARHPNALNVYIVDDAGSNGNSITLAYYHTQHDWVVARRDQINGTVGNAVLPHEVGHFFSLLHTFNGWESNPFDPSDLSWPVAQFISPDGVTPTEKMNGTNWASAGDFIQDTPPDYNFGLGYSGCNYTAGAKDPNGTLVDPMENNMMGYFLDCTTHEFTNDQQALILTDLGSSHRNYLHNSYVPPATTITTPSNFLIAPANGATVQYYNNVTLEWNAVAGATYYLLEVDFLSANPQAYIVNTTSKVLTNLNPNKLYQWRVRPFNEYVTCANAQQRQFRTSTVATSTQEIAGLTDWQVAPNPAQANAPVSLFVRAENTFTANIRVFDATGRQVYAQDRVDFPAGDKTVELPLSGLQAGLYFIALQNNVGQQVRKLSVVR